MLLLQHHAVKIRQSVSSNRATAEASSAKDSPGKPPIIFVWRAKLSPA